MAVDDAKLATTDVDETSVAPSDYTPKSTPGPVARGLSKALMQGAFAKFGQAFTQTGDVKRDQGPAGQAAMEPFIREGEQAANALEMRWHTMDYENFQAEHIEPYIAKKREMLDDYQRRHAQLDEGWIEGPDGTPMQIDITTKEGRLKAVRMRGQLEKKFYQVNTDMDLEVFNEAGKYSGNPLIVERVNRIAKSTSNVLMTMTNPEQTMASEDIQSQIRAREERAEAAKMQARATATRAKSEKQPRSYAQAIKHPEIGAEGIMTWFVSSTEGLAILHAPGGGASFVNAEREIAKGALMKDNPELMDESPELLSKLNRLEPQYVAKAAAKYLEHIDPKNYERAKMLAPHFFDLKAAEAPRGIVSERMSPKAREQNVDAWKTQAENHFNDYMANPDNDPNIDAALDNLNQWLQAAIYGDTDEPKLQAITAARGAGTTRYVSDVLEQVSDHIRLWWASKGGSGVAREENPEAAKQADVLSGRRGTRRSRQAAKAAEKSRKKRGIL